MHIAYITTEYPHPSCSPAGGIGSFVKLMAKSLLENDLEVTIFLCLSSEDKIWYDTNIKIVQIKALEPSRLSVIKNRWHLAKRIKQHIKTDAIDVIEAPDWEGMHAFCNFEIPMITRIHGSVTYFNHLQDIPKSRLLYHLERRAIRRSQKVVGVSTFSGNVTKDVFSFSDFNFTTIYNGIDTNAFAPAKKLRPDNLSILYFGTLARKKGVLELAHIFNELHFINPKAQLIVIGKDTIDYNKKISTWELMQRIFKPTAQKQVMYKGAIPYVQMSAEIEKAAICVFPSFAEAFPISWLEAMALEKPIVASSIGWACESIENKCSGLLVHPSNHKEYARKIESLLVDKKKASQLGIEARKRVVHYFDQAKLVQQNINLYKSVCAHE